MSEAETRPLDRLDRRCNLQPCDVPAVLLFRAVWPAAVSAAGELLEESTAWLTDMQGRHVRACQTHTPEVMARLAGYPQAPQRIRAVPMAVHSPSELCTCPSPRPGRPYHCAVQETRAADAVEEVER